MSKHQCSNGGAAYAVGLWVSDTAPVLSSRGAPFSCRAEVSERSLLALMSLRVLELVRKPFDLEAIEHNPAGGIRRALEEAGLPIFSSRSSGRSAKGLTRQSIFALMIFSTRLSKISSKSSVCLAAILSANLSNKPSALMSKCVISFSFSRLYYLWQVHSPSCFLRILAEHCRIAYICGAVLRAIREPVIY